MHPPPFDHVAYLTFPSLPPLPGLARDSRPQPEPVKRLGRAIGMTVDGDGNVWIFVEPAEADLCVHKVDIIHCRRACPPEVYEHDIIRRRTMSALIELFRDEAAAVTP